MNTSAASTDANRKTVLGPRAPGVDMRPQVIGRSLGVLIVAGIGDDQENVIVPCPGCSTPDQLVVHTYRHKRIDGPTFHTRAACKVGDLAGQGVFVRVIRVVPGNWLTHPSLF